jgi:molybdopterin-guanine dinucleotide biosynthesis protein A
MAVWVVEALRPWTKIQVVITGTAAVGQSLGLPSRPDLVPGLGPMGGLVTGLSWAKEEGLSGVVLLACDLPLVRPDLIGSILTRWPTGSLAVVPGSHGPLGFEPLCAGYSTDCLGPVQGVLESGKRAMDLALQAVGAHIIHPDELGSREELTRAFMNVNTKETAVAVAESLGRSRGHSSPVPEDREGRAP